MEIVIVEREYDEPLTDESMADIVRRGAPCLALRRVTPLRTYLSKDRRRAICTYEGPDAASVRAANDEAGVAYTRVWSCSVHPSETDPRD